MQNSKIYPTYYLFHYLGIFHACVSAVLCPGSFGAGLLLCTERQHPVRHLVTEFKKNIASYIIIAINIGVVNIICKL